ncbi:MAG TPA: hypothetical protein VK601_17135, partial [Kofleriaceae bacterium]|nr:hypothetical protein [Kofleriaceae bacterium]
MDVLVEGNGRVSGPAFAELVAHARERGVTSGELKALLEPADYLRTSRVLRAHGIGLADVRLDAAAWTAAAALAREFHVAAPFPDLPNARPGGHPTEPAGHPAVPPAPAASPHGGTSLGAMASWKVETSGAVVTFETKAGDRSYPAVVLTNPAWQDPEPARALVAEHRAELAGVTSLAELTAFVRRVVTKDHAYFEAAAVTGFHNKRYGIQDARRHGFFTALGAAAADLKLPAGDRPRVAAALAAEQERL